MTRLKRQLPGETGRRRRVRLRQGAGAFLSSAALLLLAAAPCAAAADAADATQTTSRAQGDPAAPMPASTETSNSVDNLEQRWNFHAQDTETVQGDPAFPARYTHHGFNSLPPGGEIRESVTAVSAAPRKAAMPVSGRGRDEERRRADTWLSQGARPKTARLCDHRWLAHERRARGAGTRCRR